MSNSSPAVFETARLGPIEVRNRTVKAATYESLGRDGFVTDELIAWHREIAEGGVGVSTLAYCSVSGDGRTFKDQLWMRPEAVPGFRDFTAAIAETGATPAVQLGHAGWFADPKATKTTPIGPAAQFSPHAAARSRAMTDDDIQRVTNDFADAAALAVEAGFRGLELHLGHGYLLSQFLCPWNNSRDDRWGGSVERRAAFPRQVCAAVKERVGDAAAIWAKLNMEDGFAKGMSIDDGIAVARMLDADGHLDAIQLTGGHTTKTPMFLMRGATPRKEMFEDDPSVLRRTALRVAAPFMIKSYEWEEAFFRTRADRFKLAVDTPLMLLGGITSRASMVDAIDQGYGFVAIGRALIREPDLIERYAAGEAETSRCVPCNLCMAKVGHAPTRCVYRP